jgi:hypothetical protein
MSRVHRLRSLRFRSIWISDIHLGFRGCRAESLLSFLKASESEHLYMVGDIVELWKMRRGLYWPQSHNDVARALIGCDQGHPVTSVYPLTTEGLDRGGGCVDPGEVDIGDHQDMQAASSDGKGRRPLEDGIV